MTEEVPEKGDGKGRRERVLWSSWHLEKDGVGCLPHRTVAGSITGGPVGGGGEQRAATNDHLDNSLRGEGGCSVRRRQGGRKKERIEGSQ